MTVMRVLLIGLCVCMLRECEGARVTAMLVWGIDVVVVSAGHVGDTRDSGTVSSAADVLWISFVRGMRGVGKVFEMFMCLARDGVGREGDEWIKGLGLGFTNPVGTGGVLDVYLCLSLGCVDGVDGEWVGVLDKGLKRLGGVMSM